MLACICNILALIDNSFYALARIIDLIADIVFCMCVFALFTQSSHIHHTSITHQPSLTPRSITACIQSQTCLELKRHPTANDY